ncbi:MAG: type II CAAX prenyl endopeptidase Rce1 family protein [Spirochaetia bacterium]
MSLLAIHPVQVVEDAVRPQWYEGLAASFYGGFIEEYMMRLFLMTGIVWIISLFRRARGVQPVWAYVLSILFAGILFGIGHLGAAFAIYEPGTSFCSCTM